MVLHTSRSTTNARGSISTGMVLLVLVLCPASSVTAADRSADNTPTPGEPPNQSAEQIVDIESAPPEFQSLIKAGNVRLVLHEPSASDLGIHGYTKFEYTVTTRFRMKCSWRLRQGAWQVTIKPTMQAVVVQFTHHVTVPKTLDGDLFWTKRLVRHEFDHVAVSSDPKLKLLIAQLLRRLPVITRTADAGTSMTEAYCREIVNEEIAKRREAVGKLVQANHDLLDKVTRHGMARLPDREAFFNRLYSRENLEEAGFPYSKELLSLLKRKTYGATKPLNLK